jgi:hypothetical protein
VSPRPAARSSATLLLLGALLLAAGCSAAGGGGVVDADGDGFPASLDCDDVNPAVHASVTVYLDLDRDGAGAGLATTLCTDGSAPPGFSLVGTDCAPDDPAAWRAVTSLPVDRDGDGVTVREAVQLCLGATVPAPYLAADSGNDCDDADPALFRWVVVYRDQDGDGVGAGPRSISCLGTALPAGWSRIGPDIDDLDRTVWAEPDVDQFLRMID